MLFPRSSGILLHPISLPSRYGIGDLGDNAYRFVDFLSQAGQSVWHILPFHPTSYGDSPYQTLSVFAGNPMLISLDKVVESGWLTSDDLADTPDFPTDRVDYGWVISYKNDKLALAYQRFSSSTDAKAEYATWCESQKDWLEDFSLFMALKDQHGGRPWIEWPEAEALRDPETIKTLREQKADQINAEKFKQWLFFTQWDALRAYAMIKGIRIWGDIPIFVAHDSADVWCNRDLFQLDDNGSPTVIAGVPPDYFSATGQRWGNPLYRWPRLKKQNYDWWQKRVLHILALVDVVRIDHFRGFDANWEIPSSETTAINGQWVPGPGSHFFEMLQGTIGELPLVAEDLGVVTPEVEKLRDDFNLPGMKVLQFAWSAPENPFLPHNHTVNSVVYTGTHDNNTIVGWYLNETDSEIRDFFHEYLGRESGDEPHWDMIRIAMQSVAHTAIIPLQDILGLGSQARMNTPGAMANNWSWRFQYDQITEEMIQRLHKLTYFFKRLPEQQKKMY